MIAYKKFRILLAVSNSIGLTSVVQLVISYCSEKSYKLL